MKKLFVFFTLIAGLFGLASCGYKSPAMSHAEFMAAENGDDVIVEGYISARQSWWEDKATLYLTTNNEGEGYFVYEYQCTEEEFNSKLVVGACLRIYGAKTIYDGEHEIMGNNIDYEKSGVITNAPKFNEKALNVTKVNNEELIKYQNGLFTATLKVKGSYSFKNDNENDDIYFTLVDEAGNELSCCVECYVENIYPTVKGVITSADFVEGASVTVTGYLYWWKTAANPHITSIVINK